MLHPINPPIFHPWGELYSRSIFDTLKILPKGESTLGELNGYRNCVLTWRPGRAMGVAIRHLASAQQAGRFDFRRRNKLLASA